jgi:hypothetical protein
MMTAENRCIWEKTYPSVTLSTTNPTRTVLASKPALDGNRLATNSFSRDMASASKHVVWDLEVLAAVNVKVFCLPEDCMASPPGQPQSQYKGSYLISQYFIDLQETFSVCLVIIKLRHRVDW